MDAGESSGEKWAGSAINVASELRVWILPLWKSKRFGTGWDVGTELSILLRSSNPRLEFRVPETF